MILSILGNFGYFGYFWVIGFGFVWPFGVGFLGFCCDQFRVSFWSVLTGNLDAGLFGGMGFTGYFGLHCLCTGFSVVKRLFCATLVLWGLWFGFCGFAEFCLEFHCILGGFCASIWVILFGCEFCDCD